MKRLVLSALVCLSTAAACGATEALETFEICTTPDRTGTKVPEALAARGWSPTSFSPDGPVLAMPEGSLSPDELAVIFWFMMGDGESNRSVDYLRHRLETALRDDWPERVRSLFLSRRTLLTKDGALLAVSSNPRTTTCNYIGPGEDGDGELLQMRELPYRQRTLMEWVRIYEDPPFLNGFAAIAKPGPLNDLFDMDVGPLTLFGSDIVNDPEAVQ